MSLVKNSTSIFSALTLSISIPSCVSPFHGMGYQYYPQIRSQPANYYSQPQAEPPSYYQPQYQAGNTQYQQPVVNPHVPPIQPPAQPVVTSNRTTLDLGHRSIKTAAYTVKGIRYQPMTASQALYFRETGICSIYHGSNKTAMGEVAPADMFTAAHKTLPLPCVVKVTNHDNRRTIYVRVNDRGPFVAGRILDLNKAAATALGLSSKKGLTTVTIEVMSVGDGKLKVLKQSH